MAQSSVFANAFREDKEKQAHNCHRAQEQNRQTMAASLPDSMNLKAQLLSEQLDSLRKLEVQKRRRAKSRNVILLWCLKGL